MILKCCPECNKLTVEFDGTFSRCLNRECCWMIRGEDFKEGKIPQHKFSKILVKRAVK